MKKGTSSGNKEESWVIWSCNFNIQLNTCSIKMLRKHNSLLSKVRYEAGVWESIFSIQVKESRLTDVQTPMPQKSRLFLGSRSSIYKRLVTKAVTLWHLQSSRYSQSQAETLQTSLHSVLCAIWMSQWQIGLRSPICFPEHENPRLLYAWGISKWQLWHFSVECDARQWLIPIFFESDFYRSYY